MQGDGLGFGDDHRPLARAALAAILEERMAVAVERHLDELAELGEPDRRNGCYGRRLLTALGAIEFSVPRTRAFSAGAVLRAYARREAEVDRMILACFVLGLSTRKVGEALLPILGERVKRRDGEPGGQDPRWSGGGLPRPSPQDPLSPARARRRGARP